MVGTLVFTLRNVPQWLMYRNVVWFWVVLVSSVLVLYRFWTEKKRLRVLGCWPRISTLPTATWGGHMGHFLLSVLILTSSTPLGNTARSTTWSGLGGKAEVVVEGGVWAEAERVCDV